MLSLLSSLEEGGEDEDDEDWDSQLQKFLFIFHEMEDIQACKLAVMLGYVHIIHLVTKDGQILLKKAPHLDVSLALEIDDFLCKIVVEKICNGQEKKREIHVVLSMVNNHDLVAVQFKRRVKRFFKNDGLGFSKLNSENSIKLERKQFFIAVKIVDYFGDEVIQELDVKLLVKLILEDIFNNTEAKSMFRPADKDDGLREISSVSNRTSVFLQVWVLNSDSSRGEGVTEVMGGDTPQVGAVSSSASGNDAGKSFLEAHDYASLVEAGTHMTYFMFMDDCNKEAHVLLFSHDLIFVNDLVRNGTTLAVKNSHGTTVNARAERKEDKFSSGTGGGNESFNGAVWVFYPTDNHKMHGLVVFEKITDYKGMLVPRQQKRDFFPVFSAVHDETFLQLIKGRFCPLLPMVFQPENEEEPTDNSPVCTSRKWKSDALCSFSTAFMDYGIPHAPIVCRMVSSKSNLFLFEFADQRGFCPIQHVILLLPVNEERPVGLQLVSCGPSDIGFYLLDLPKGQMVFSMITSQEFVFQIFGVSQSSFHVEHLCNTKDFSFVCFEGFLLDEVLHGVMHFSKLLKKVRHDFAYFGFFQKDFHSHVIFNPKPCKWDSRTCY